jgi:Tfp pilus tip-associated adhesin PilY1
MKKFFLGVIIAILVAIGYNYVKDRLAEKESLEASSSLIEKEIRNVSKLIVSEGSYAQIYNYKNTESFLFDVLSARKKALIIVNAEAAVSYDLSKMQYEIDEENKTLQIISIPEPELKITPDFEFYDVTQYYLNQFKAEDYNSIKQKINKNLRKKIEKSSLMKNAENRLISELQKLFVLTNSQGWTLLYKEEKLQQSKDFERLKL